MTSAGHVRDAAVTHAMMTLTTLDPPAAAVVSMWTQQCYGDQTAADTDQASADTDRTAADMDQEASDRDFVQGGDAGVHADAR